MDEQQTTQTAAVEDGGAPVASKTLDPNLPSDVKPGTITDQAGYEAAKTSGAVTEIPADAPAAQAPVGNVILKVEGSERVNADGSESADYLRGYVRVPGPEKTPTPPTTTATVDLGKPTPPPAPQFYVSNRSKAQRVAKLVYGPFARVWIGRDIDENGGTGVHIGTEVGAKAVVSAQGKDFSEALRKPVEDYIGAASSYKETKTRIQVMQIAGAENLDFALDALKKWPEYQEEIEAAAKKNPILAKIAETEAKD